MKVGSGGNFKLGLSREYYKKVFGPTFPSFYNCPLKMFKKELLLDHSVVCTATYLLSAWMKKRMDMINYCMRYIEMLDSCQ